MNPNHISKAKPIFWAILSLLVVACSMSLEDGNDHESNIDIPKTPSQSDFILSLSPQQEAALDAFNTLQTSTDEINHLYSTFANSAHSCSPAETSFSVTQSQLAVYMTEFVSRHCQNLQEDIRNKLAETAVLAQDTYTVLYCNNHPSNEKYKNGLPLSGTWVLPNIVGQRDVVLIW